MRKTGIAAHWYCASSNVVTLLVHWLLYLTADVTRTAVSAVESTQTLLRVHDDAHSRAGTKCVQSS